MSIRLYDSIPLPDFYLHFRGVSVAVIFPRSHLVVDAADSVVVAAVVA